MTPTLRPDQDIPVRMLDRPIDPQRGIRVPWFVPIIDGKYEFRAMSGEKWRQAVDQKLCWTCGKLLGAYQVFALGPLSCITRATSEPPNHLSCARWAVKNCPFLSKPRMVRRGHEELIARGAEPMGGIALDRNPGVALLWTTPKFKIIYPDGGGMLIQVGDPTAWEFWYEGRKATRDEIQHSIDTGLPALEEVARQEPDGMKDLAERVRKFELYLPEE